MVGKPGLYVAPALILLAMSPAAASTAPAPGASPGTCTTWARQASPNPGHGDNNLYGVTATSASNAWAVGEFFVGTDLAYGEQLGAGGEPAPAHVLRVARELERLRDLG